jgi:hypothetical protein
MSWRTIDPSEIRVTPREKRIIAEQLERDDTLPEIIASVAVEVQGYVATRFPVGPAGTFPDELREAAKAVIVVRFLGQIPSDDLITKTRDDAAKAGIKAFEACAAGRLRIVDPATPAPTQAAPGIATVTPGNDGTTREDLSRL